MIINMIIDQSIFKAYDFRGIYPTQLNEEIMERIGRAFVEFIGEKKIIVGVDTRLSSPALMKAFIAGATAQGADIVSLGTVSTDCLYFASGKYNLAGVMITASHNPKEFNGVKFCRRAAEPIGQDTGLMEIKELVLNDQFESTPERGQVEEKNDILVEFREHCHQFIQKEKIKPLKIVADAGNGMAGKIVPAIFDGLPCQIIPLFFELNGDFPNHHPSPIDKDNNRFLIAKVIEEKADLGLAFDGDADRVFFIDERGEMVDSSFITAMIAKKLLEKNPGAKIIYTVTSSRAVPEIARQAGGEPIMTRVGHVFIKQLMKESKAIFAGEHSGHYYFIDNYRADSGVIAALIVIQLLSESGKPMSELMKEFELYYRIEETNSEVADKEKVMARLKEKYNKNLAHELDGLTFEFDDWWFNVRPSNTESLLRLNLEAKKREVMEEKAKEVLAIIRQELVKIK